MVRSLKLLAGVALLCAAPATARQIDALTPVVERGETMLLVEAEGFASVQPEKMSVSISVISTGKTAREALNSNNTDMQKVIDALKSFDIAPGNLETRNFSVEPRFATDRRTGDDTEILGYKAENRLSVTLTDLTRGGEVIAAAFEAGANSVDGPYFDVSDETASAARRLGERKALADARAQADSMASALGMRVSRVLRVSDRNINFDRGNRGGGYIVVTGSRIMPTPIEIGEIPLSVEVFVEYALVAAE